MSDSLWPREHSPHTRLPCPLLSAGVCSDSCQPSQWCCLTISSSADTSSAFSFLASGSSPMSRLCPSGDQRIGASASAPVLSMNIQDWFSLGLTSLISLQTKGLSRVFSSTTIWKHQIFGTQPSLWSSSHLQALVPIRINCHPSPL